MRRPHPAEALPELGSGLSSDAWSDLLRAHVPALFAAVARRVGPNRQLTEDLVQETWLRAVASWSRGGLPRDPSAWLRTTAFNLLRDQFKRLRPEALTSDPAATDEGDTDSESARRERASALVQRGLTRLPRASAELLAARHFDGKSLAALAEEHRTSERAIEGRLRRARGALGCALQRLAPSDPDLCALFPDLL